MHSSHTHALARIHKRHVVLHFRSACQHCQLQSGAVRLRPAQARLPSIRHPCLHLINAYYWQKHSWFEYVCLFTHACTHTHTEHAEHTYTHTHTTTHTHILVLMGLFRIRFDVRVENLWLARKTKAKQHGAPNHTTPPPTPPGPISARQCKLYENNNHCVANA